MTLIELLVAFTVFVMLVAALVSLGTAGLNTWQAGEMRKDIYDRAQRILGQIEEDLRNTWADDVYYRDSGGRELQHAYFVGDWDKNKAPRLRLVRSGTRDLMMVNPNMIIRPPTADINYTDLWEVAYVMDNAPEKPVLHRLVRYFDRRVTESILNAEDITDSHSRFFQQVAQPVDDGVLWLDFRFWTQYTTTWFEKVCWVCPNADHAVKQQYAGPGKCALMSGGKACGRELAESGVGSLEHVTRGTRKLIGPSPIWDSSRHKMDLRWFFKKRMDLNNPDFVYPAIVQVTLVLESTATEGRGVKLIDAVDDKPGTVRVTTTRTMPDGPAMAKIEGEWISYQSKSYSELQGVRRGLRGTVAAGHGVGAMVRFGETFVTDVKIPAYRDAVK